MPKLSNCDYNKIKVVHDLSRLQWFLEKHAIPDAANNHPLCANMWKEINQEIAKWLDKPLMAIEGRAKEGKLK